MRESVQGEQFWRLCGDGGERRPESVRRGSRRRERDLHNGGDGILTSSNGKDEMPTLTASDLRKQVNNEAVNSGLFVVKNHNGTD